jgi:hypothetical protein
MQVRTNSHSALQSLLSAAHVKSEGSKFQENEEEVHSSWSVDVGGIHRRASVKGSVGADQLVGRGLPNRLVRACMVGSVLCMRMPVVTGRP